MAYGLGERDRRETFPVFFPFGLWPARGHDRYSELFFFHWDPICLLESNFYFKSHKCMMEMVSPTHKCMMEMVSRSLGFYQARLSIPLVFYFFNCNNIFWFLSILTCHFRLFYIYFELIKSIGSYWFNSLFLFIIEI